MGLKERLIQRDNKINEEIGKAGVFHSISYHNHFEGYAEYYVPKKNGKGRKIQHVYVGEYYSQELTRFQRTLLRFFYAVLFLGGAAACMRGACVPVESNRIWYVNLPEALVLPCMFWTFLALLSYLAAAQYMKKGTYRFAVRGIRLGALLTGACLLLSAIATAVFICLHQSNYDLWELLSAGLLFAAALGMFAIYLIERRIPYKVVENDTPPPSGSTIL